MIINSHLDMKMCLMHNGAYEPTITHRVSRSTVSSYKPRPQGDEILDERKDRETFITLFKETANLWNVHISAFCLMNNYYHILAQTPPGNLARFMRHLNGVYTQRYNRLHNYDGQLFRGRYKSHTGCGRESPFGTGQIYSQESRSAWNS